MKRIKKILLPFLLIWGAMGSMNAQSTELGLKTGVSLYFGDIANYSNLFGTGDINPSLGIYASQSFSSLFALEFNLNYCKLSAHDFNAKSASRAERNLSFESNVFDASLMAIISPIRFELGKSGDLLKIYGGFGIGVFKFDPYTYYNNQKVFLNPLGTEGQGIAGYPEPYKLVQINIPLSVGFKFQFDNGFVLGVEGTLNKLFTDYLDDVSGFYLPYDFLASNNGSVAAQLADRSEGSKFSTSIEANAVSLRGDNSIDDNYGYISLLIGYTFNYSMGSHRKIKCYSF